MLASFSAHKLREAPSVQIQLSRSRSRSAWLFEWEVVGLLPELPSGSISKVSVFPPPSRCWLPPPAPSVCPSHRSVAPYLQAHSPSLCFDVRALIVNTALCSQLGARLCRQRCSQDPTGSWWEDRSFLMPSLSSGGH